VNRSCFLSLAACRTPPTPGTCVSRSVSGACAMERCSPSSAPFPPQPPQKVALPCSAGSQVLRHSPTSPARARPPCGFWPSRTGLDHRTKARWRSPGSRACCFSACAGSQTTQDRQSTHDWRGCRVAFLLLEWSRHPDLRAFRSSMAPPTGASVYASRNNLAMSQQDSRSGWIRYFLSC